MAAKVLLVGGAGYVGSVLAGELVERGFPVRILDRLYYGDSGLGDICDRVELVERDMRTDLPEVLDDVDAVVNMGGLSNDPTAEYNPRANHSMNTLASIKLAEQCIAHGIRRYVFASSCSIYDRGVGNDATDTLQDESSEVEPKTVYAGSRKGITQPRIGQLLSGNPAQGDDLRLLLPYARRFGG
jgi:nucleoside-diphosphate-sugar epimerase